MLKSISILFCYSWLATDSFAGLVPAIPKCEWKDKACLIRSTQMAIHNFGHGIPEIGISPLDPIQMPQVSFNEAGMDIKLKNIIVRGLKRCKITDAARNLDELWLKYTLQCPVDVRGNYVTSGQFFTIPIGTETPFRVHTDKLRIIMTFGLAMFIGEDGQKHWKLSEKGCKYKFLHKKLHHFKYLLKKEQENDAPSMDVLEQNKKELMHTYSKFIINEIAHKITSNFNKLLEKIPAKDF